MHLTLTESLFKLLIGRNIKNTYRFMLSIVLDLYYVAQSLIGHLITIRGILFLSYDTLVQVRYLHHRNCRFKWVKFKSIKSI